MKPGNPVPSGLAGLPSAGTPRYREFAGPFRTGAVAPPKARRTEA